MAEKTKTYELAYHLHADVDEAKVPQMREEIEKLITSHEGTISFSKEPEKHRLSYPINHSRASYFGYVQFMMPNGDNIAVIDEQIRLNKQIIRHIILKFEPASQNQRAPRPATLDKPAGTKVKKPAAPVTEKETKEMEQELDKVISGL